MEFKLKVCAVVLGISGGILGIILQIWVPNLFIGGTDILSIAHVGDRADIWAMFIFGIAIVISCFMAKNPREIGFVVMILGVVYIMLDYILPGLLITFGGIVGSLVKKRRRRLL